MDQPNQHRRLAAIMFTDIVGYTKLMGQDESQAVKVRKRHRAVFNQLHTQYHGEILQYFGDGTLSIFQSGIEAVNCAIAIQQELQRGDIVPLRIGLHIGDIVYDGTEIYGDSVNITARIESLGVAGAVFLSGKLNAELANHLYIQTYSLGIFELKNVAQPIEVFAIKAKGLQLPKANQVQQLKTAQATSIAVLPLLNLSADTNNEYFCDGLTEELINALSKIEGLKVTSRTSSFFFKNKTQSLAQISEQLKVSIILEGSIRLWGNKMRISIQLIDVAEDFHFWSESFDRSVEDLFAVQDEVSLLVADKLREHIGHLEIEPSLVEAPPVSIDYYKSYLKGRYHILKMTQSDIKMGLDILQEILVQAPDYAHAHLGMHLGYTMLGTIGFLPAGEAFFKGSTYLEQAIQLAPDLPECQLQLSYMAFLQAWDLPKAYQHVQQSFSVRPTVEYYQSMASMLLAERKFKAALHYIDTAQELDPLSGINYHLHGCILYSNKQYKAAIQSFDKAISYSPGFMPPSLYKGQCLLMLGQYAEGLSYFQSLADQPQEDILKLGGISLCYAAMGAKDQLDSRLQQIEEKLETALMDRALNFLILCNALAGRKEKALYWIEQAIAKRLPMLVYLNSEPMHESLQTAPRFQEFVRQVIGENTTFDWPKRKYKKTLFSKTELQDHKDRLLQFMAEEKPYLDADLSLRSLAEQLDIAPNYLSQLLNEGLSQNFSEFVNSYRLQTFKTKVTDPRNHQLTILALAYDSGFNSKTVFNTFFKKMEGKTPSVYWKEVVNN